MEAGNVYRLLQGLLRSSQQVKLADFLNRDFSESKNKEAACKNAFVLLGQHRYEMAAAFFLLGKTDSFGPKTLCLSTLTCALVWLSAAFLIQMPPAWVSNCI